MSGCLLVVGKLDSFTKHWLWCRVIGNSICWYFLVKCTQLFSRFHSQKPRTNLPRCIQIPIALSFADVPCGVPSLLCFAITGPVIAIRMPQHATTPWTALARPEF